MSSIEVRSEGPDEDGLVSVIGVGCFWFASKNPKIEAAEYFALLVDKLSAIENVTDIQTTGTDAKYGGTIDISKDDEDPLIVVHRYYSEVKFRILIPRKVQERLEAVCCTETFDVSIVGHYHLPVTYVTTPAADFESGSPSTAIVLVKRYLKEKFGDLDELTFDCVGPSPFHADFITSRKLQKGKLVDLTEDVGYKQYVFGVSSDDNGLQEFSQRYGDTFSLFYELQMYRSKVLRAEIKATNTTNQLVNQGKSSGWFAQAKNSYRAGRLIDEINEASLEDQLYRSFIESRLKSAEQDEPKDRFDDLKYHFNELRQYAVQRSQSVIKDIVETSEKRRQGLLQNVTVLIAGVIGGVVGAVIGSSLTYSLTSNAAARPSPTLIPQSIDLGSGVRLISRNRNFVLLDLHQRQKVSTESLPVPAVKDRFSGHGVNP